MNRYPYNGTWIACGAYAFIQASGLDKNLLIEVENCAGATFGMKSLGREWDYTRILTPFKDFHCGIDDAAYLWGINIKLDILESPDSFKEDMLDADADGFVFGPVNMEGLRYLVLPQQYHLSDHFFAVKRDDKQKYVLYDSEGIPGMSIDARQIADWLCIANIPESNNKIYIRTLYKYGDPVDIKERLDYEISVATRNFKSAAETGQGANAFLLCRNVIEEDNLLYAKWRESLFYNLNYVVQRRLMMVQLIERASHIGTYSCRMNFWKLIKKQIQTSGCCLDALGREDINGIVLNLKLLYESEVELLQRWEDWLI